MIGRGSCDSGLLTHTHIRVHAGPLSNLVMVGFLKKKTFPLAVARTREQFSAPPPNPLLPISLVPIPQGQGEKHCIQTEGSGHFSAGSG